MLYENTTLTAHYLPASLDSDADGIADGHEIYWYGDLSQAGAGDSDGDGFTFAQELANGTNPLVGDEGADGPICYGDGSLNLYNPSNYVPYTIKSEPEGSLLSTVVEYVRKGTYVTTGTQGTANGFAYWRVNGVEQRDAWGRAVNGVDFMMPTNAVELVAVKATGDSDNDGVADNLELYWYGDLLQDGDSDTDGDGFTFAQELANGTNPLVGDEDVDGPIGYADGDLLQYNPHNYQPYLMRSEPEGVLFATVSNYVSAGLFVSTGTANLFANGFAYWTLNGDEQRDAWGRAIDNLNEQMPTNALTLVAHVVTDATVRAKLYWYGTTDVPLESDTDGDGYTFAQELANGTNPHVGDESVDGPVTYADTELHEANLQVYEQVLGALVDGQYAELFTSPIVSNNAMSVTFGGAGGYAIGGDSGVAIWPVVADINSDGLWDLVVCSETTTNVFVNVGSKGNPQFANCGSGGGLIEAALPWCDMNSTAKLAAMSLDVEPVGALSATTNGATLLVSDEEGRIWLYSSTAVDGNRDQSTAVENYQLPTTSYQLLHKVWGGSCPGFAQGLRLAAVDWEDDGDLDCLCGTADGKLMLLRDPKVGRPTNLRAAAGVDNVKLDWDPNAQSRVRGYRVYRGEIDGNRDQSSAIDSTAIDGDRVQSTAVEYCCRGATALPTYRDTGLAPATYAYKVSALSRFYTAGNSTPTETESVATDPVFANIGSASFFWNDAAVKQGERVEVMLSIENSLNYNVAGKSQTITFDPEYLTFVKVAKTGLTESLTLTESCENGQLTVSIASGTLAAGSGKFLSFVFEAKKVGTTKVGDAMVVIEPGSTDPTEVARYSLGDMNGDGKLNGLDVKRFAQVNKWMSPYGAKSTPNETKAGDFNGDGRIHVEDVQPFCEFMRARGIEVNFDKMLK